MGDQRQRKRIRCKIDDLPEELKEKVHEMLSNTTYTYWEISEFLKEKDYDISKSSVGRYALRVGGATQRLLEAQQQTQVLVQAIKKNPDLDYTDAGLHILMDALVKRISMAQEEFDGLPLDKAGRLIASISRTKVYKDRVKQDMMKKIELAFQGLESDLMVAIKSDPELAGELKSVLERAKEKMMQDD
jgi:hypothetical protein